MNEEVKVEEESSTAKETTVVEKKARRKKGDADGRINYDTFISSISQIEKDSLLSSDEIIEILKKSIKRAYLNYIYPNVFRKDSEDPGKDLIRAEVCFERKFKEIKIYDLKIVTKEDDIIDDAYQISEEDALEYSKRAKLGDTVKIPFNFIDLPNKVAKQSENFFNSYLAEASKQAITKVYSSQINGLIEGTVTKIDQDNNNSIRRVEVSFGKASGVLTKRDLLPQDRFSINDKVLCYLSAVSATTNPPSLTVSRSNEQFVAKLFERAVPELEEGIVKIVKISREVGLRTKIFVTSTNKSIDPVGTCIGPESSRERSVIAELKGEKIDILPYYENKALQIIEAMKPAIVTGLTCEEDFFDKNVHYDEIEQDEGDKYKAPEVTVVVMNGNLGIAIGVKGVNVRLASKITKCNISVLEADKAIEQNVDYKLVTTIKDIVREMYPDEIIEDKFAITSKAQDIDDEDEEEDDETIIDTDSTVVDDKKEETEQKTVTEKTVETVKETPVSEEKVDAPAEQHITITHKPRINLDQLENILTSKKKDTQKKSYRKKTSKKKDDEETGYAPVENAMPIYTEEELKQMEDTTSDDYDDETAEDYDEYDSDEYYDK